MIIRYVCSPLQWSDILLEVDVCVLFKEDINVAVETCSSRREGWKVVTQLLTSLHCLSWYVSSVVKQV